MPPVHADSIDRLQPVVAPGFAPGADATESGLWMLMDEAESRIRNSPNRLRDPELEGYIRDLVCRLVPEYCGDIRVYILRVPEFNATMSPNGMMQVWTGLLLRMENEAQLASVLGHELGHYLRRHSLDNFKRLKNTTAFLSVLSIGLSAAVQAGQLAPNVASGGGSLAELAGILAYLAYSRSDESESDRYGVQLVADAGLAAAAGARVWTNLIEELEADESDSPRPSLFFMTHPLPKSRADKISEISGYIGQFESGVGGEIGADAFQSAIRPNLRLFLEDELNRNEPGSSIQLLERIKAAGRAPGLVTYFLGEAVRARGKEGDVVQASSIFTEALTHPDCPPDVHRALGTLLLKEKRYAESRDELRKYLAAVPEAPDREMVEYYLTLGE
ncbi:MAG: M48 family metalloprotease [Gammaproteobacteria bacterium]|nr:M48 family metalloprotease [Gammaproteobacteria bacterium]